MFSFIAAPFFHFHFIRFLFGVFLRKGARPSYNWFFWVLEKFYRLKFMCDAYLIAYILWNWKHLHHDMWNHAFHLYFNKRKKLAFEQANELKRKRKEIIQSCVCVRVLFVVSLKSQRILKLYKWMQIKKEKKKNSAK